MFSDQCDLIRLAAVQAKFCLTRSEAICHLFQVIGKYDNLFAHIVIEPMGPRVAEDESKGVASFLATYGCLARVEKVKTDSLDPVFLFVPYCFLRCVAPH
jgi:hypothetical protein